MKAIFLALCVLVCALALPAQTVTSVTAPIPVSINGTGFAANDVVTVPSGCAPAVFVSSTLFTTSCPSGLTLAGVSVKAPCTVASLNVWTAYAFASQSANFEMQFDATPSTAKQDGVVGFGSAAATAYASLPGTVRFNDSGTIDSVQGASSYSAVTSVPYAAGTTYHITIDVNLTAKTYSAYVGTGAARQTIALNYAFRTGAPAASISALTLIVDEATASTLTVCNFALSAYPASVTHANNLKWSAPSTTPEAIASYQVDKAPATSGPYAQLANVTSTAYTDPAVTPGAVTCYEIAAVGLDGILSTFTSPICLNTPTP